MDPKSWYERELRKHLERRRREAEELADGTYEPQDELDFDTEPIEPHKTNRLLLRVKYLNGADLLVKRVDVPTEMGPVNLN